MTNYLEKHLEKETAKRIAIDILRYFETNEVYLEGVSSPVFRWNNANSFASPKLQSKYRKMIWEKNPYSDVAHNRFVMPSVGLARALTAIAAGYASAGLSSTGEGVAELVCADGSVQYAVYNPFCGRFKACVLSKSGKDVFPYKIAPVRYDAESDDKHYSTALVLALLPFLMEDEEFSDGYNRIMEKLISVSTYKNDLTEDEITEMNETLATISDNADLRIRRDDFDACICIDYADFKPSNKETSFILLKLSDVNSDGHYFPVDTKIGEFSTLV